MKNKTNHKKYKIVNYKRFVTFIVCAVLMIAACTKLVLGLTISEASSEVETVSVTVQYGDSLWSLAKQYGPANADVRVVIYNIQQMNNLSNADIYPGQTLQIPTTL